MKIACLIPVYNEQERIGRVLAVVTKIKELAQVVCVDDGSIDGSARAVEKFFPKVRLIRLKTNQGKTAAIRAGLKVLSADAVLLLDADLHHLNPSELVQAIKVYRRHRPDMLILRRVNSIVSTKLFRGDIVYTGERIMPVRDLKQICSRQVEKFQIEAAVNYYCIKNQKTVFWFPITALSTFKIHKRGFWPGLWAEVTMALSLMEYKGIGFFFEQILHSFRIRKLSG